MILETMTALMVLHAASVEPAHTVALAQAQNDATNDAAVVKIDATKAIESDDPARLINLGIAYAREGREDVARTLLKAAMTSKNRADLETASGKWRDSRSLARQAMRMLEDGQFRSERLSMRK